MAVRPLSEIFADWPPGVAESLYELITIEFDDLRDAVTRAGVDSETAELIYDLRSHGVEIRNSATTESALSNPTVVAKMLGIQLRPPRGRWITYALDATRHRVSAPHKHSGSRYLCTITGKVPSADELVDVPSGGAYLLVRNDTPAVLEIPGVLNRIEHLATTVPLADVIIYDKTDDDAVVYSLRANAGTRGSTPVELPIAEDLREKVRGLWPAQ